jgi:hypothetical protein
VQVERDHWQLEGHVFHRLVHGGKIVERILGIGRQPDIGGGQYLGHQLVGRPAGEIHVPPQAQLIAQGDQIVEAVA